MTTSNHLKQAIAENPAGIAIAALPKPAATDLQKLLVDCGYQLAIDGNVGPKTKDAFRSWKAGADQNKPDTIGAGSFNLLVEEAMQRRYAIAKPEAVIVEYSGREFMFPGIGTVCTDQPIITGGSFTFGEATHNGTRPPTAAHAENIIKMAELLQPIRNKVGRPMRITSWYRPEPFNSRAGGASNSQHLYGRGVDIAMAGETGKSMLNLFGLEWYRHGIGGAGIYPGIPGIIHLDCRGYPAKWGW